MGGGLGFSLGNVLPIISDRRLMYCLLEKFMTRREVQNSRSILNLLDAHSREN